MLKVTVLDTSNERKFILEGKLTEPWVSELESAWNDARQSCRGRKCVIDLRGATLVDESGKRILAQMCSEGAQFIAKGVYTRCLIDDLEQEERKNDHAVSRKTSER